MNDIINKLLEMCSDVDFDPCAAEEIVRSINLNQEVPDPTYPKLKTSFLMVATNNANINMVRLLLQHGADPNFILNEDKPLEHENPFWDLQYNLFGESAEDNEVGLQMAQLMLDYGANPAIELDDEDLFSYVCFAVFNDDYSTELWEYRSRFFILLIAYGGSNDYCKPEIIKEFDKSDIKQYHFLCVPCGDGYHVTGEIVDRNYEVVAKV